jgi:taurine dioxygenase
VNPVFTTNILDLPTGEGDAVLKLLFEHCNQPQFQARFRWKKNSVAFWDNRCVQHIAMWDYFPQTRSGNRITLKGDKPF